MASHGMPTPLRSPWMMLLECKYFSPSAISRICGIRLNGRAGLEISNEGIHIYRRWRFAGHQVFEDAEVAYRAASTEIPCTPLGKMSPSQHRRKGER